MTRKSELSAFGDSAQPKEWRLIISQPQDGARNMAIDEAIFRARAQGLTPPTLRLYRWEPPAVSLGRFQALDEGVNCHAIAERGYGLVRRPTGGRGILHSNELTYSVAVRETDIPDGDTLMGSYKQIARGIQMGLRLLGVQAASGWECRTEARGEKALPTICFAKAARADLVAHGRKIVGSAQTRSRGAILQHGSIPLTIDLDDLLAVLPGCEAEPLTDRKRKMQQTAVALSDLLGRLVSFDEAADAICGGFARALGVSLQPGQLTSQEEAWAEELVATKYGTREWTEKVAPRS